MPRYNRTARRAVFALVLALGAAGGFKLLRVGQRRTPHALAAEVIKAVPASAAFFKFRGGGFADQKGPVLASDTSPLAGQVEKRTMLVSAPRAASGEFRVSAGSATLATVRLVGATAQQATVENGAVAYRSAYPAVDIVAVRDPERFELTYILNEPRPSLNVDLALGDIGGGTLTRGSDGAITVKGANGRPRLRLDRPAAIDARGTARFGTYATSADVVHIALETSDLVPPIVLDPAIYIPYWTLVEDDRQPGSATYSPPRGSRETQLAFNPQRGRPWLIRPVRSQQGEDHSLHLGTLDNTWAALGVSSLSRTPGTSVPTFSVSQLADWQRTFFAQSETWEWSGTRWQLLPQSGLAGLIDPSFAYAPGTAKMVAFGGATPEFTCSAGQENSDWTYCSPDLQSLADTTSVFENDGTGWIKKGLSGAPPPRVRPAMSTFGAGVLVFGGRGMRLSGSKQVYFSDLPFPDSLASDLLNDTWVYDGVIWKPVAVGNPPPAQEAAQMVYDSRRKRALLVGGNSLPKPEATLTPTLGMDPFSLWEFDGSDWVERFEPGDTRLPVSFQKRRGVAAIWHPVRQTTILFGGFVDVLDSCPFSGAALDAKRADTSQANVAALTTQGCMPGYAHDAWEWDGATLKQLTQAIAGGVEAIRTRKPTLGLTTVQQQVYQQVAGALPAPGALASDSLAGSASSHLWPWRYDASANHYPLRSALERAYSRLAASAPVRKDPGSVQAASAASQTSVSPLFAASTVPQLSFDPASGRILVFPSADGRVFDTDLQTWVDRTPSSTPFDAGQNDFFAATWDVSRQKLVLFDPRTGLTWEHSDNAAWVRSAVSGSPGIWSVDPSLRSRAELDAPGMLRLPKMSYDRARARTVMVYRDSLWEYDGSSWVQRGIPASLTSCAAATMMTFDGKRNRTVVVGCSTSPAQTWEWDGSTWYGPFASPFVVPIRRGDDSQAAGLISTLPFPPNQRWQGTLQLPWAHPNALFESPSLGGVGTIDAGQLTVWDGTAWKPSVAIPEGHFSDAADQIFFAANTVGSVLNYGLPYNTGYLNDFGYVPNTFAPPVVEDFGANRLLAFRDGVRGLRSLSLGDPDAQRHWEAAPVGWSDATPPASGSVEIDNGSFGPQRVYPHPFELLTPEQIGMVALTNQSTRTDWDGVPKSTGFPSSDEVVTNLFWPFRLLSDPVNHRIRILTHRGALWEMGSEQVHGTGESCVAKSDCANEDCDQGVCCFDSCSGACHTCNGSNPGHCEASPVGSACTPPTCSNGILTASNQCAADGGCAPAGPPAPCAGGLACASGSSCVTHCGSSADCADPTMVCSADGLSCTHNYTCKAGVLYQSNGTVAGGCPGGFGCADGMSCKTHCAASTDCSDGISACSSGGSCVPDSVTQAAAAMGVSPTPWKPTIHRSRADVADAFRDAGYEPDDAGRFAFGDRSLGGVDLAYDPNLYDPTTGLRSCVGRVNACFIATGKLDECVAGAPRCVSATPWKNDPGGEDCCPDSCLLQYFSDRKTKTAEVSFATVVQGTCYPGLQEFLNEDSP